jgi:hypothetical protein
MNGREHHNAPNNNPVFPRKGKAGLFVKRGDWRNANRSP